jgi:glycosyltransferase involved in cell wall biosynthesis
MKILFICNLDWMLYQFRLPLLERLRDIGFDVVLVCPLGEYTHFLREKGFRIIEWKLERGSMNVIKEILAIKELVRIYRTEKPNVVQHITIKPNIYGCIAARFTDIPIIVNNWDGLGYIFSQSKSANLIKRLLTPVMKWTFKPKRIWANFANSENADLFIKLGLAHSDRTWRFTPVGVDIKKFSPNLKPHSNKEPKILMASRLLWQKGVYEYIEAARELIYEGEKAQFFLCGDRDPSNPSSIPISYIQKVMDEGIIHLMGHRNDMPYVLADSDIVVLPSYHEGIGTILLEAASAGLPLVATDIPGCRLIVHDEVNGLLVEPGDVRGLSNALRRLIRDQSLRRRFGSESRRIAEERFSWEEILKGYEAAYVQCGMIVR